jgi:hypothetical protein
VENADERPAICTSICTPIEARDLEAAIVNVTRLLAKTDDPGAAAELVRERAALRRQLLLQIRDFAHAS